MIETVSMKTLMARDPDHRARTKPMEMTSTRPGLKTSSKGGTRTWAIADWVRKAEATSTIRVLNSATDCTLYRWATKPTDPASPNNRGGKLRTAKKADSAASPITR